MREKGRWLLLLLLCGVSHGRNVFSSESRVADDNVRSHFSRGQSVLGQLLTDILGTSWAWTGQVRAGQVRGGGMGGPAHAHTHTHTYIYT